MANDIDGDALMHRYAAGDANAFRPLYAAYKDPLYRFVRRLLGRDLQGHTDEVFQEAWLKVIDGRTEFISRGAGFRAWLFAIAYHSAIDRLRRSGREVAVNDLGPVLDGETESTVEPWHRWPDPHAHSGEDLLFWRRAGQRLLDCLEHLPPNQRATFLMHHQDELTLAEIAAALKLEFETAKSRLRYAMTKLRGCMGAFLEPMR